MMTITKPEPQVLIPLTEYEALIKYRDEFQKAFEEWSIINADTVIVAINDELGKIKDELYKRRDQEHTIRKEIEKEFMAKSVFGFWAWKQNNK